LLTLLATFLKLGAIAFGSGYVLLAFLRSEFVLNLHWLTDPQVVDAIALSQATPGPVFTTATFLGFLVAGVAGAPLATLAIFLPGGALVPLLGRIVQLVRRYPHVGDFLKGVNAAAIGLIVAAAVVIARDSMTSFEPVIIAPLAFVAMLRQPVLAPAIVILGGLIGALTL
jgi:chromate transporter